MGSSCFARGNKKILTVIQEYISKEKLEQKVIFKGNHCFGRCKEGPMLKINEKEFEAVNVDCVIEILEKELGT